MAANERWEMRNEESFVCSVFGDMKDSWVFDVVP